LYTYLTHCDRAEAAAAAAANRLVPREALIVISANAVYTQA